MPPGRNRQTYCAPFSFSSLLSFYRNKVKNKKVNATKESNQEGLLNMKKQTVSRKESPLLWLKHMATKHRLRSLCPESSGCQWMKVQVRARTVPPGGDYAELLCSRVTGGSVPSRILSALLSSGPNRMD